jgi:hypothetical protein
MVAAPLYINVLSPLPPVPSIVPIPTALLTSTVDEDTTTWTDVDIGIEHPHRIVVLAFMRGATSGTPTATVNGIPAIVPTLALQAAGIQFLQVPSGSRATITLTNAGSVRKAVQVYVAYPNEPIPIDAVRAFNTSTSDAVAADLKVMRNGFVIYAGGQLTAQSTYTVTWSGTDAVTEDVDATLESVSSYTMGRILVTAGSDLDDLTLAASLSGTKAIVAVSWASPVPGS